MLPIRDVGRLVTELASQVEYDSVESNGRTDGVVCEHPVDDRASRDRPSSR